MIPFRNSRLLPIGHLTIDVLMLVLLMWHTQAAYRQMKTPIRPRLILFQEAGAPGWDFRHVDYGPPPEEFLFLGMGNLPAMAASVAVRPHADYPRDGMLWDPVWFLLHESIAVSLWFLIGSLIDSGRLRIQKLMRVFLVSRGAFAVLAPIVPIARIGAVLEGFFWLGLILIGILWGLGAGVGRLREMLHDRRRS